ncbi:hypothetical protein C8R43DRAFT_199328 [Mycena crocata]|nr:hypothetical protein C8R43DRAFT_199328 [Mycena crocata]
MAPCHNQPIFALYKAVLRQTRKLPHLYLRQFWRIKASDDVRAILETDNLQGVQDNKIKRMSKDLRKLEAANKRNVKAFSHVLDVAYGRKGKLKRELMEPVLTDPTAPSPPRIIPAVESSRPPVYSKELTALLTSEMSRTTRALTNRHLSFPPKLPARADPTSEEAQVLGPFSKRRETNARWRYFTSEWQKVRPPLQVVVKDHLTASSGATLEDLHRVDIRSLSMQDLHVFEDVEKMAGPRWVEPERRPAPSKSSPSEPPVSRWVRRQYQALLNRLPILTYQTSTKAYSVSLSANRLAIETNAAQADRSDLGWMGETTPGTFARPQRNTKK